MKTTAFPVEYAQCAGMAGCTIVLGGVRYFSPIDDPQIYCPPASIPVLTAGPIPEPMATYVRGLIEGKLQACGRSLRPC